MLIDTPAKIAILGAGPIGLEAALYARYLGYEVQVFEQGRVGESLHGWGHARMFTPFGMNRSPLGLAALAAQEPSWQPPGDNDLLTGREYLERYLEPLAASDLLGDCVHLNSTVKAVTRRDLHKGDPAESDERGQNAFRLLVADAKGHQQNAEANIVLDCSGATACGGLGQGGAEAVGEAAARERILYSMPDVLGAHRDRFAGQHSLVVGDNLAAAATVVALSQLAREALDTHVTWMTRGPLPPATEDTLPERARLRAAAATTASNEDRHIEHWSDCYLESIEWDASEERFAIDCGGKHEGTHWFDSLVAPADPRPVWSAQSELRLALDPVSEAPLGMAARLAELGEGLDPPSLAAEDFITPEPNYYVLGAKSYGRDGRFLIAHGLAQIVALFSGIAGRETLDLYATALPAGDNSGEA